MNTVREIVQDIKTPQDAKDAIRRLEYAYPFFAPKSSEQAIAIRAFRLLEGILERNS